MCRAAFGLLLAHERTRAVDDAVPLECGAGIDLVCLDVEVAEHTVVVAQFVGRKFVGDELAGRVARVGRGVLRWRVGDRVTAPLCAGADAVTCASGATPRARSIIS